MNNLAYRSVQSISSAAKQYLPEPAINGVGMLKDTLKIASNITGSVNPIDFGGLGEFKDLIQMQLDAQKEMQQTSMLSNIEKSKHETSMAPIRNIRVN